MYENNSKNCRYFIMHVQILLILDIYTIKCGLHVQHMFPCLDSMVARDGFT